MYRESTIHSTFHPTGRVGSSYFPSFRKHAVLSQFRPARSRGSQPFVSKSCACLLREPAVIVSKETHCFRVVSNLDNTTKDTLEKEIANDDIVVSNINIKATPKIVFVQDKLVAAYNFHANDLDEHVNAVDDEINEVKAAKLVKSCSLLLEHQEHPR